MVIALMEPAIASLDFMATTVAEDLAQPSAQVMVYAKPMGSVNVKVDGLGLTAQQRFVMSNVVCTEESVIMVNVNSAVQIMQATLVRKVLQYCPACQCAMMYWLGMLTGSIVHQVNSVFYNSLKQWFLCQITIG
jgi:hypothetical protein